MVRLTGSRQIAARVCAVFAAAWLVAAFALASLFPPELRLGQLISLADYSLLVGLQDLVRGHLSPWLWSYVCVPLLLRPAWFVPAALGIVSVGLAVTLNSRAGPARSRRRS